MWLPECVVWEKLGTDNIPGDPWRGVPNFNGYQLQYVYLFDRAPFVLQIPYPTSTALTVRAEGPSL